VPDDPADPYRHRLHAVGGNCLRLRRKLRAAAPRAGVLRRDPVVRRARAWRLRQCGAGPGRRGMKNRLKVLRAERDWSQADLADKLEVSRQSVNAIETGKYDPSLPLAFRIADLFGLAIEDIFQRGE